MGENKKIIELEIECLGCTDQKKVPESPIVAGPLFAHDTLSAVRHDEPSKKPGCGRRQMCSGKDVSSRRTTGSVLCH